MRKIAWPYTGTPEAEMGSSDNFGNYRDIIDGSQERLDSLSTEKFTNSDSSLPTNTKNEGVISGVHDDSEPYLDENSYFDLIFSDNDGENVNLLFSSDNINYLEKKASFKYNIYCISRDVKNSEKIVCYAGDPKYHVFSKKFDAFYINENNLESIKYLIKNFEKYSKNISNIYVKTNLSKAILDGEIKKIAYADKFEKIKDGFFKIRINKISNSKIIGILDKDGNTKAAFVCDIANNFNEKMIGLQAYSSIKNSFGLLFPYKKATDVSYHMGTVNYPIDIIFIGDDSIIKKITKNIQPGDAQIYQCGGVKNVLEITGGLSTSLGLSVGDSVYIDDINEKSKNLEKTTAIKTSSSLYSNIVKYDDVSIKIIGNNKINKYASEQFSPEKKVLIVDINDLFNFDLNYHKAISYDKYNVKKVFGSSPKTLDENFEKISAIDYLSKEYGYEEKFVPETYVSLKESFNPDTKNAISSICNWHGKVAIASNFDTNYHKLKSLLSFQSKILLNKNFPNFELFEYDSKDGLYYSSTNKYSNSNIYFLNKKAGIPVSDDIKNVAKESEKILKDCKKISEDLLLNLKKNLSVYQTIQSDKEKVKSSKFEYNESVKRNSEILKKLLIETKKSLKLMNSIKDISNTFEIINSVTSSTMRFSEITKNIFELVEIIENDDFITQLTQKTGELEKISVDLTNSIKRMIDYINKDILGVLVITP